MTTQADTTTEPTPSDQLAAAEAALASTQQRLATLRERTQERQEGLAAQYEALRAANAAVDVLRGTLATFPAQRAQIKARLLIASDAAKPAIEADLEALAQREALRRTELSTATTEAERLSQQVAGAQATAATEGAQEDAERIDLEQLLPPLSEQINGLRLAVGQDVLFRL